MRQIADYQLERLIGQGNHGQIYLATAPERLGLDRAEVAVKVLAQAGGDDAFKRLANELKLFATVRSPHLVELYDAGQHDGVLFYVMEYFPHGTLENPDRELERSAQVRAVADAARAAHALHEAGVAHRDIKPANIVLTDEGAKLSDLGLAQILSPGQTTTGFGPIGSIEYMEPGVIRGERAGRASDVWGLGVTLHRVVTGQSVYGNIPDNDVVAALRHILQHGPAISPGLEPDLREIVGWCLQPERAARPSTAAELAARLDEVVKDS